MFNIFREYLSDRILLSNGELALIQSLSVEKRVAKRAFVLHRGEISGSMIFVARGLLRLFNTDQKGDEHILRFANENRWINDRESYLTGNPSDFNIDAVEDSEILIWKKSDFDYLLKEMPAFKELMKTLGAKNQIANQNRIYTAISYSAEEKYRQFIEKQPAIYNRVPLYMIASYLGVSRETLSRIRKQAVAR
jgi:CRP-like cAMP-binding protein